MMNRVQAFMMGFREGHEAFGMTWGDDPGHPLSVAYDYGRALRQRLPR